MILMLSAHDGLKNNLSDSYAEDDCYIIVQEVELGADDKVFETLEERVVKVFVSRTTVEYEGEVFSMDIDEDEVDYEMVEAIKAYRNSLK